MTSSPVASPSGVESEGIVFHFSRLCRRLLAIDPVCDQHLGCPFHIVALPMIKAWRDTVGGDQSQVVADALDRMWKVNGEGRTCEMGEIQYLARKYLTDNGFPL